MDITLTDIAKYAYGNGFNEGIKGGRGFLTVSDSGELSKVYTHRSDAKKLNTLSADDFQALKAGSDRLAQSLFQIAKTKLSGQWLAAVCDRLGLDETGVPREGGENAPRAQRLLDRKVVASVVSLIDPNVWNGGKEGGVPIARKAKEVTTARTNTDGAEVLASQREISKLVGDIGIKDLLASHLRTIDDDEFEDNTGNVRRFASPSELQTREKAIEQFSQKFEQRVASELARLPKGGARINGRQSRDRQMMAEQIVPLVLRHLAPLLKQYPKLLEQDVDRLDLTTLFRMWPRTSSKIQDKDISLEIVDSKTGVGLRDELEDYDLIDEKKQKELNRAARVAVKNALTDVKLMVSDMGRETLAYQPSRHLN